MPDYLQQSFNGGEISPQVLGQVDFAKYNTGCKKLVNWVCLPHGPIQNRSGTEFIAEIKDSTKKARLIPFVPSIDSSYVLECGEGYIRPYTDGSQIQTQEFVINGSMEEDRYWSNLSTPTSNLRSSTQAHSGTYSREFITTGAGEGIISEWFDWDVPSGTELDFSAWVYPSVTSIHIRVRHYNQSLGGWQAALHSSDHVVTASTWNEITFSETLPSSASILEVSFYSTAGDPAGTFYIDDVSLSATTTCNVGIDYEESDIFLLDYAQSVDELYIVHKDWFPRELLRYSDNAWFAQKYSAYFNIVSPDYQWTASGSGTNEYYLELNGGGNPGFNEPTTVLFSDSDSDKGTLGSLSAGFWGFGDNDTLGYDTIYYRATTGVDPDTFSQWALKALYSPSDFGLFGSGVYGDGVGGEYAESVCFHNDRLIFTLGEKIYGSMSSIYNDFSESETVVASDGLDLRLGDGQLNQILYARSFRGLTLLTTSTEWSLTGADGSSIITATSKKAEIGGDSGSDQVRPLKLNNSMIHVLRHKKSIKELFYDFSSDKFVGAELTILAEHLLRNYAIVEMAYQRSPYKIIWAVREDGTLLGLTYFPEQKVFGWHRHEIGGNGEVESVCVIPGDGVDEVWLVVKRTIDGSTARYVERMHPFFVKPDHGQDYFMDDDTTDAIFMDSSYTVDNRVNITSISSADPAILTISGLSGIYSNGDTIRVRNVVGMLDSDGDSGVNGFDFTLANIAGNTAELQYEGSDFDSTVLTAYSSGGTAAKMVTSVTGLDHLEGETVTILGDGQTLNSKTVSGGAITLDTAASVIHVGLGYNSDYRSLPPRIQSEQLGYLTANEKQIKAIYLQLFETTGLNVGVDQFNLRALEWIDYKVPTGHPPQLFSTMADKVEEDDNDDGLDEISFEGKFVKNPTVFIRQSDPLPATIAAIGMDIEVSSG